MIASHVQWQLFDLSEVNRGMVTFTEIYLAR